MIAIGDVSRTLADKAYSLIREAMHSGQLKPGHKLRFSELEGHRGYRVAPVSSTDLWDIVRNRQRLESEALSLSIKHGDDHWEAQLVTAHHLLGCMDRERADLPPAVDEKWEPRHQA